MRHGEDTKFSCKGIQIAVKYWEKNGHQVLCFLPEYLFDYRDVNNLKQQQKLGLKKVKASKLPDSVAVLHKLNERDLVVKTPAQDYDDSYCINYAREHNAFIVSNDKFRDYIQKL